MVGVARRFRRQNERKRVVNKNKGSSAALLFAQRNTRDRFVMSSVLPNRFALLQIPQAQRIVRRRRHQKIRVLCERVGQAAIEITNDIRAKKRRPTPIAGGR